MAASAKWTWDKIEKQRKPVERSQRICMRNDLVNDKEQLEIELYEVREDERREGAMLDAEPLSLKLAQRIVDLEKQIDEANVTFTFAEIGTARWNEMLRDHPPTKEQQADGHRGYNPETFPNAVMAASCVAPTGSTVEHFERAFAEWGAQYNLLWETCLAANIRLHEGKGRSLLASQVLSSIGTGSEQRSELESL